MTAEDFRRIALGMDGAVEGAHMGHPDFRAFGRIFATLHQGDKTGMVKLTPEQQKLFVRDHPDGFLLESGAWGAGGATRVVLASVDQETLGEAMTLAWRNVGAAATVKRAPRRAASPRKRSTASRSRGQGGKARPAPAGKRPARRKRR
jgi:hypothetical protein